ncbi:ISSpo8, transposase [Methylorubrum populi BJ001]|jgi:transposase-like protein|uniref:ISSpo8, transposase n=1 Tax=Methylorubrum populi (strain ATCC BAA-705 / NCIMB 13946 / BJ001) TaxID=441620 RepID=B1ZFZ0_METPB|nr:IS1595-like element ISMpo2 family transposase [Methylorubrum populi]ACB78323.1 ISSpo8, transposase [Methylorubrum populi BJ001]PZP66444.1 MAG: IS1595 family transposase ISMpo2 [Methylorubrum populi]
MSALSAAFFHDEAAAFAKLESLIWPEGPVCPHCGGMGRITNVKGGRMGLRRCGDCKKQFTVTVGTVFESSHVKLHLWLQAAHLLASSKKGFSAHQLHRTLGVTYKTAWFMFHRLREAMRDGALAPMGGLDGPAGGAGIVEADETFIGREPGKPKKRAYHHKMKVLSLVDRDTKQVRSVVVDDLKPDTVKPILAANIAKEASLFTDEAGHYVKLGKDFIEHQITSHGKGEYVRGIVHTNTVEGYFSVFKRGMKGVYQHCGKQHLHRYLAEFDFRYNNRAKLGVGDVARTERALYGIIGKRLTYRSANRPQAING